MVVPFLGNFLGSLAMFPFKNYGLPLGERMPGKKPQVKEGSHCASHLISVAKMNKKSHKLCHLIEMGTISLKVCFKVRH